MNIKANGLSAATIIILMAFYIGYKSDELGQIVKAQAPLAIEDYQQARSIFWNELYPTGGETLYCAEQFKGGYNKHINIEHVFPMSWVAWKLQCGKRKECRENSDQFNLIEADLHNLYPARADINEKRSSHPFGLIKGEKRRFGNCDFEIDYQKQLVEPREEVRGDIARAMFYMADHYDLEIRKRQYEMLMRWHKSDPATQEERKRNNLIKKIQGNKNPYIK